MVLVEAQNLEEIPSSPLATYVIKHCALTPTRLGFGFFCTRCLHDPPHTDGGMLGLRTNFKI